MSRDYVIKKNVECYSIFPNKLHGLYTGYTKSSKFRGICDELHGDGHIVFDNGDEFNGTFRNDCPYCGTYTFANGSYIYVFFVKSSRSISIYISESSICGYRGGKSCKKEEYSNGYYSGEFKNGKRDGIGEYHYKEGDVYAGGWKDNNKHGVGKYTWADGTSSWMLYDNDKLIHRFKTTYPQRSLNNNYSFNQNSSDYDSSDYDYSYSSSSSESSSSYEEQKMASAIDAYNRGDYASAKDDLESIKYSSVQATDAFTGWHYSVSEMLEDIEERENE